MGSREVQPHQDSTEFPTWTRARPQFPLLFTLALLSIYLVFQLLLDGTYSLKYAYQVPLLVGFSYGFLVSRRVGALRSMAHGVPESDRLIRLLAVPLSRPPWMLSVILGFAYFASLVAKPLGLCQAPPSVMDFETTAMEGVQTARYLVVVLFGLVAAILVAVLCRVMGILASGIQGTPLIIRASMIVVTILIAHRGWMGVVQLDSTIPYAITHPSVLLVRTEEDHIYRFLVNQLLWITVCSPILLAIPFGDGLVGRLYRNRIGRES